MAGISAYYLTFSARKSTMIKVKLKLLLYLTKQYAMKTYWGSGGNFHASLTVALNGDE